MRNVLKTRSRRWNLGWLLPLALLALPNCLLDSSAYDDPLPFFQPGGTPVSDAIMCEIPMPRNEGDEGCATDEELAEGGFFSTSQAATLLASGQDNPIVLDWSDDAKAACDGGPRKVEFYGTYPDGLRLCINCGTQIDEVYATPAKACIAKCRDLLIADGEIVPAEGVTEYCLANAKVAINVEPATICYPGACTEGGNKNMSWFDPRRHPEKVVWIDASPGVEIFGADNNSLKRNALATGSGDSDFNEGAGSAQTITTGDAWVEFEAGQTGVSHVIGLRESCEDPGNCPDNDYGLTGIGFSISLNADGNVYVLEPADPPGTFTVQGPFGSYVAGERYRVKVTDLHNGKTDVSYVRITGDCPDGTQCTEQELKPPTVTDKSKYPLRVDAIFREEGATLENVTIMRIKQ